MSYRHVIALHDMNGNHGHRQAIAVIDITDLTQPNITTEHATEIGMRVIKAAQQHDHKQREKWYP